MIIDATIYVGGLDEKVAETLLWELFLQAGPVGKIIEEFILYSIFINIFMGNRWLIWHL